MLAVTDPILTKLKIGFMGQLQQQQQKQKHNNYSNISAIIDPIFTKLYT